MGDNRRIVCWQGWKLSIPHRWDPVKLEGDHGQGYALFADTQRPRLGLRWQTLGKKKDAASSVRAAMNLEVGQLAAEEAKPYIARASSWQSPLLYIEPQPPGRDVFCAFCESSNRVLQVVYHAYRRENVLATTLLPTLADQPIERATCWSIFDLNLMVPGEMFLKSHRLNAGDLGLTFADKYQQLTVRQIAVAQLALQRQSLDGWIADQQKSSRRYHRSIGKYSDIDVTVNHRALAGRMSQMTRRRRYAWMWDQPPVLTNIALHDSLRDRLILLHGPDESLLRVIAATVGTM